MNKEDIFNEIDCLRKSANGLIAERILNYLESNISDFIECYKEVEE